MPNIATRFLDFCKRYCAQCTRPVVLVHGPHVNHEIDDLKHFPFCNVQHLNMRTKAQFQFSLCKYNKPTHTRKEQIRICLMPLSTVNGVYSPPNDSAILLEA